MPESFKVTILNPALRNWPATIRKAIESAGATYPTVMKRYPPQSEVAPDTKYVRTGTLGNTSAYKVDSGAGKYTAEVGGVNYTPYVLHGTKHWAGWPGKLEMVISELKRGFGVGLRKALHKG